MEYNRGHWEIENRVHYVRDVTFDEDRSQVRTAGGPRIMASIRNLVMGIFRLLGFQYIPDAIRNFAMRLQEVFRLLGILPTPIDSTSKLVIANGLENPAADVGPMANSSGIKKTIEHITDARSKGATIAYGGDKPAGKQFEKGYFFTPTVLTDVNHDMLVMKEESFGPIVGIMPYGSVQQSIEFANSTRYGLATYVYTDDLHETDQFIHNLQSGNVAVNNPDAGVINAPYGGFKESGMGYEHGPEGMEQYLAAKHVRVRYFNRKR